MAFAADAHALIEEKKFDDLESLWMNQMESDPSDIGSFLRIAKELRKAEQRTQSDTLLSLLADTLQERGMWRQRLDVLKEIGRPPDAIGFKAVHGGPISGAVRVTDEVIAIQEQFADVAPAHPKLTSRRS